MSEQQADPATEGTAKPAETGEPHENGAASGDSADAAANSAEAVTNEATSETTSTEAGTSKKSRTRKQSTAKKSRTVELTLTVTGTAEGEWQADLMHAGKRVVQGLSIPATSVSKAAAELHQDISEAIESVLHTAREQHEAKLAELEAEVEKVRKALADLEG